MLKRIWIKFLLFFSNSFTSYKVYEKYFGIKFGKNIRITGKVLFGSEPYLIEMGDNITITNNVVFHTHDGGAGLFRKEYNGINVYGRVKLGSNIFIGSNSIILFGVTIGDNVVIGTGSVVTKDIPSNSVVAGVPARIVKTIEEYKKSVLEKGIKILNSEPEKRKQEILQKLTKKESDGN